MNLLLIVDSVLFFLLMGAILAIISRGLRNNTKGMTAAVAELKEANNRGKVDLERFLNPPTPPCHHNWQVLREETLETASEKKSIYIVQCADCGAIDKTVESVKKEEPPCHHSWKVIKDEILEGSGEKKLVHISQCGTCGEIYKATETVKREPQPQPRSECHHNWVTQKTKEIESAYEQIADSKAKGQEMIENPQPWMFRKCYVITRICARCGEINTVEASNYDLEDMQVEET